MLYFKNAKVAINGTGILADSANLDLSNSITNVLAIGKRGAVGVTPNGELGGTLNLNYLLEPGNDPANGIVDYIKNGLMTDGYQSFSVEIAGITGDFYLSNYSVKVSPNDVVSASASFITYGMVSGDLNPNPALTINPRNDSGIAHSYTTTFFNAGNQVTNSNFYNFEYSFRANWNPFFILGRKDPVQVTLGSAEEQINIDREVFNNAVTFTGDLISSLSIVDKVKIFELSYLVNNTGNFLDFNMDGYVKNVSVQASTDDLIKVNISAEKQYN